MKKLFITVIAALCCHLTAPAGDIFVSPTAGNDKAAGTREAPLKTLEQALKQAREWRRLGSHHYGRRRLPPVQTPVHTSGG